MADRFEDELRRALRSAADQLPWTVSSADVLARLEASRPPSAWRLVWVSLSAALTVFVVWALVAQPLSEPPIGTAECRASSPIASDGRREYGGPRAFINWFSDQPITGPTYKITVRTDPPANSASATLQARLLQDGVTRRSESLTAGPIDIEDEGPGLFGLFLVRFPEAGCWSLSVVVDGEELGSATFSVSPPIATESSAPVAQPVESGAEAAAAVLLADRELFRGVVVGAAGSEHQQGSYYEPAGDGWRVVIRVGWGDCPAGCIYEHEWRFNVSAEGDVSLEVEAGDPLDREGSAAYSPPVPSRGGSFTIGGQVRAGDCGGQASGDCVDGKVPFAEVMLRTSGGLAIERAMAAPLSGRFEFEMTAGIYILEPQGVEGLSTAPAVAFDAESVSFVDFVYDAPQPYRRGALAEVLVDGLAVAPVPADPTVKHQYQAGDQVYVTSGPALVDGAEWYFVEPEDAKDPARSGWVIGIDADTDAPTIDIASSGSAPIGPCQPIVPGQLPSGAPAGDIRLNQEIGESWIARWGSPGDRIAEVIGRFAWGTDPPGSDARDGEIRGVPAWILSVEDPGQLTISWEQGSCRYGIWLPAGMDAVDAAEYAARF